MTKKYTLILVLAASLTVLCAVGLSNANTSQKPEVTPRVWEYKVIRPEYDAASFEKELNQAGADGWEVAGAFGYTMTREQNAIGTLATVVFKRLKK